MSQLSLIAGTWVNKQPIDIKSFGYFPFIGNDKYILFSFMLFPIVWGNYDSIGCNQEIRLWQIHLTSVFRSDCESSRISRINPMVITALHFRDPSTGGFNSKCCTCDNLAKYWSGILAFRNVSTLDINNNYRCYQTPPYVWYGLTLVACLLKYSDPKN